MVKRTQLKRSVYRVLGTSDEAAAAGDIENGNGTHGGTENGVCEEKSEQDKHLHDYDPEIFDDDDFYHQVSELREILLHV